MNDKQTIDLLKRVKVLEAEIRRLKSLEHTVTHGLGDLSDPNADRILFWDDSEGALKWLTVGTGLTITNDTLTAP